MLIRFTREQQDRLLEWAGAFTSSELEADVEPSVDGVETVADDAMLGIGVPAPRSPRGCPRRKRQRESSWTGVQAPCPVYVRSPDRLNTSAQLNAVHTTHGIK